MINLPAQDEGAVFVAHELTKREYFAVTVTAGLCAQGIRPLKSIAVEAVELADALIVALERKQT